MRGRDHEKSLNITFALDTSTRAIGKRAHPLHSLVYYSIASVLFSTVGYVVVLS